MNRRCVSSKPTPTPLNGLAMEPGNRGGKKIEGNVDHTIWQTTNLKPAAGVAGEKDRKGYTANKPQERHYVKANPRRNEGEHRR